MDLNTALEVVERRRKISEVPEGESGNGRAVLIDEIHYKITCPRFGECKGPGYNEGFVKYLCSNRNHGLCATQNPDICIHNNFAEDWHRARLYPAFLESLRKRAQEEAQPIPRLRLNEIVEAGASYS